MLIIDKTRMKTIAAYLVIGLVSFSSMVVTSPAADQPPKIKVLLVTGDDVAVHPWREVSQAVRDILVSSGKFDVFVSEDAGILDSSRTLGRYDMVFFHMYNQTAPTLSDTGKENLVNYVKGGHGFVVSHLSSASFKEWDEFAKLCGRHWVMGKSGHGPRAVFKARIANKENPITQGLPDFDADDELYAKMEGDTQINVLVEADSDWSKKTEPLAFTFEYGQGRVFHETFGHDGKALQNPTIQKLIQRGCEWAATGKVR